ncbi:uncharacterized protein [Solanum lycopersicum]|uniref:uncharacterized protein n=1 Tax=Solanum lycopersicum TaxID=4081 RepID=UPI003747C188
MTNQHNRVHADVNKNGRSLATRVGDFIRMNPLEFLGSQTNEDPQIFFDEVKKIFEVMKVIGNGRVELESYQLEDVSHILYTQWRKNRGTKTYPTCRKCGKKHPGECLAGKDGCFGCGQSGHRLRDGPSKQVQGGGNGRAQTTISVAPVSRPTQKGNSSGRGGDQHPVSLYALQARQD